MTVKPRLVLASALMLFLELTLIRWLGSNIVHLSYFTNFVLLGSFLGIGLGFLISKRSWSVLPAAPIILAVLVICTFLAPVTIDRAGDQIIYFTSLSTTGPPAWLVLPLIFSVVHQYRLPAVWVGLPMLAALSVLHGFLPPHPAPTALVVQFHADMGRTFIYGLLVAVPAIVLAGPVYARTLRGLVSVPLASFAAELRLATALPGRANSFLSSLLPVLVLGGVLVLRAALPAGGPLAPAS